ncbi:MAG: hypothetical protein AAGH17_04275 [Pseudomonadota bacterium]
MEILKRYPLMVVSGLAALTITIVQLTYVNPYINPGHEGLINPAQLSLQLSFFEERGLAVIEGWGPGGAERYLDIIWVDILWPFTYGPFFFMLIRTLEGNTWAAWLPILEGVTNLVETSIEIYWVTQIGTDAQLGGAFFFHSCVAAFKWFILVPSYFIHSAILLRRWYASGMPPSGLPSK